MIALRPDLVRKDAVFSPCGFYRYVLWRIWDKQSPFVLFIGLNPSVADETQDDRTVAKCQRYADSWGEYGGICMANLFAVRSQDRSFVRQVPDPVGPDNDKHISLLAQSAGLVVAAWGNDGAYLGRSRVVRNSLKNVTCLHINKSGEPAHPLYLRANRSLTKLGRYE